MSYAAVEEPVPDLDAFSAFEALQEGVLITDADLAPPGPRILYANPSFQRMTGWSLAELIGKSPRILQGPATDHSVFSAMNDALRNGHCWEGQAVNYRKNGSEYVVEWFIAPIWGPDGSISNYIAIQRDMTQRIRVDEDLKKVLAEQHKADQTKLDFLAIMNHELRTPLNAIIGFSELLQKLLPRKNEYDRLIEYVDFIHESGDKLLTMLTDILEFARAPLFDEGRVFTSQDVGEVIERAIDMVQSYAEAKPVDIVRGDLSGMSVCAYEPSLRKIFKNVFENAVKFSPPGGRVTIVRAVNGNEVHIAVLDSGPGIPPEYMKRLFSPFAPAQTSLDRKYEGIGLGLAIAQRLAHFHGGRLEVESAPEHGTCVHIYLPLDRSPVCATPA